MDWLELLEVVGIVVGFVLFIALGCAYALILLLPAMDMHRSIQEREEKLERDRERGNPLRKN